MTSANHSGEWDLDRIQSRALLAAAACLAICAIGAVFSPYQFFRAYLVAYLFCLGTSLGCLPILMLYHLTGGAWGSVIRRLLECGTRLLPLLALLGVPLVFGLSHVYSWRHAEGYQSLPLFKQRYFSLPFFLGRTAVCFVIWMVLAYFLNAWSRQEDETTDPQLSRRLRLLSGPGLVLYGLTITFASIDWVMSLQPHWYSTIFAVLFATGQVLTAFAFTIVVLAVLASRPPLANVLSANTLNDLGNLLLAFVMIWAYMAFSQFLLVWTGNLREEIPWYQLRMNDGWQVVGLALLVFHFALPFLLLLSRGVKRNPRSLALVAGGILFMRLVDLFWEIMPAFSAPEWPLLAPELPGSRLWEHWMDLLLPVGLGGIVLAAFLWQLQKQPLLPLHDPSLDEAVRLRNVDAQETVPHG